MLLVYLRLSVSGTGAGYYVNAFRTLRERHRGQEDNVKEEREKDEYDNIVSYCGLSYIVWDEDSQGKRRRK